MGDLHPWSSTVRSRKALQIILTILQARPEIISLVGYATPPGHRELRNVGENWSLRRQG